MDVKTQAILVTGANGQLASEINYWVENSNTDFKQFNFIFANSQSLNITNGEAVESYIQTNHIKYIINCAAYTAVDKAEDNEKLCYAVNRDGVKNIALAANKYGTKVIHISTDYVFDGLANTPYKETDAVAPNSVYGASKLAGENELMKHCSQSIIIRSSWLYSSFGNNFVKTIISLGREKDKLSIVADQQGSPTYGRDLADAILEIIKHSYNEKFEAGIYHYSNQGITTWYDFCKEIHRLAKIDCELTPITTAEYATRATRPAYSAMNTDKIKNIFKLSISNWKDSLASCIEELSKKNF